MTYSTQNVIIKSVIEMDFFDLELNVTKIVLACFVPAGEGDRVHKSRPSHGLAINLSGEKSYIFESGKTIHVGEGDIIYLPQNSNYIVQTQSAGGCYAINFLLDESIDFNPFVRHVKNVSAVKEKFALAEKLFREKKYGYIFGCKSSLYAIVHILSQEFVTGYAPNSHKKIIDPALDYIHKHYCDEEISIKHLAELCEIGQTYFRRIFLKTYGTSPIKYITDLRLQRAKTFLIQTSYNINDIASMSGFNNVYWFCRCFKSSIGMTPSQYRQSKTNQRNN